MISKEDVAGLAQLARLELSAQEAEQLQKDISGILAYVGQVSAVVGEVGEPVAPLLRNVLREDVLRTAGDTLDAKEEALRKAFPLQSEGYNVVRKIVQKDE